MTSTALRGNTITISARHCSSLLSKVFPTSTSTKRSLQSGNLFLRGLHSSTTIHYSSKFRAFSSINAKTEPSNILNEEIGIVTRQLKELDISTVRRIEEELREVDKNSDGRLDADELTSLLKRHQSTFQSAFTDADIVEFSELFYAGKGGGSMKIADFIEALDHVASNEKEGERRHQILDGNCSTEYIYRKTHTSYTPEDLNIKVTHLEPETFPDRVAWQAVKVVRLLFDTATGWSNDKIANQEQILNRVIFLETVAAVPGMVAAVTRHFRSVRRMERDGGLMQLFLEEANNERMHLLSFINLKDPGMIFRTAVIVSQFGFGTAFFLAYIASPKFCKSSNRTVVDFTFTFNTRPSFIYLKMETYTVLTDYITIQSILSSTSSFLSGHRFVGYIEEEACHTYTNIVTAIEEAPMGSELAEWKTTEAPAIAKGYWKLGETGTILDLMYAVRADEAEHRDVNHACSDLLMDDAKVVNPFNDPDMKVNSMLRKYVKDIMTRSKDEEKPNYV